MKLTINYLLLLTISLTSCFTQEATSNLNNKIDDDARVIIEKTFKKLPNNTQIAIGLVNNKTTNYIGVIRKNDTLQIINNQNNVFEIGSISKLFTNILFSDFINKNKAELNEKLASNLSYNLKEGNNITLVQLANHTAGLSRLPSNIFKNKEVKNPYKNYTNSLLKEYLTKQINLNNKPGTKSNYSNLGTGLLGYILTLKSNKKYEDLLQTLICKPLQMNNTSTITNYNLLINGLDKNGLKTNNWDFTDVLVGAGGIKSSVVDMTKFIRKNFENDVIYDLPKQPTFNISDKMKIGLGWHVFTKSNTIWHNGGTGGYKSCIAINKNKKIGVIVLSNVSGLSNQAVNIDTLCFNLFKTIWH